MQHLRFSSGKKMPWKNGLGTTTEIAIYPEDSSLEKGDFLWRLSSACIEGDNQFSQFNGFDRKLLVIDGDGLILNGTELKPYDIFSFAGEEKIQCSLIGKKVNDLGVIFNREKCRCEMRVEKLTHRMKWETKKGTHFLIPLEGKALYAHEVQFNGETIIRDESVFKGDILQWQGELTVNLSSDPNYVAQVLMITLK